MGVVPQIIAELARKVRNQPLSERISAISAQFLGLPYRVGPAGEGRGQDPDPPARYETFDCVTLVEEVMALSMAPDPVWSSLFRNSLRYMDARPSYESRRHFFAMEWIDGCIDDGLFRDITATLGNSTILNKQITMDAWRVWRKRSLFNLPDSRLPTGLLSIPLLDLAQARRVVGKIPAGCVVSTVRVSLAHVPIVVSHVGLSVEDGKLRHATKMGAGLVRDDDLSWYIEHLTTYTNWPVAGINVLQPLEQGPRRSAFGGSQDAPEPLCTDSLE